MRLRVPKTCLYWSGFMGEVMVKGKATWILVLLSMPMTIVSLELRYNTGSANSRVENESKRLR